MNCADKLQELIQAEAKQALEEAREKIKRAILGQLSSVGFDESMRRVYAIIDGVKAKERIDGPICLDCSPLSQEGRDLIWDALRELVVNINYSFCVHPCELREKLLDSIINRAMSRTMKGGD